MPVGDRFNKRMQMGYPLTLSIALTNRRKAYLSIENRQGKILYASCFDAQILVVALSKLSACEENQGR